MNELEKLQEELKKTAERMKEYKEMGAYEQLVSERANFSELTLKINNLKKELEEKDVSTVEYEGVEKENPHAIAYQLDDWEQDKFLELKEELSKTEDAKRASEIRKEMADILGKEYKTKAQKETEKVVNEYEGVEKENPHAIAYQLDDWEQDKFLELKEELSKTEDPKRANEIRKEMADILGNEYKDRVNKEETKKEEKATNKEEEKDAKKNETEKEDTRKEEDPRDNYAKDGFQPPAVREMEFQPPAVRDLPKININLNVKTGECKVEAPDYSETNVMNKFSYERKYLKKLHKNIASKYTDIKKEDLAYLDKVDPTIYEAYENFDEKNAGKYSASAAEMYVKSVIEREKQLETGKEPEGEKVPGKVKISYKTPEVDAEDKRVGYEKFKGLSGLIAKARAKRLLNHHGPKGLDLAEVEKKRNLLKGILVGLGIGATALAIGTGSPEKQPEQNQNQEKTVEYDNEQDNENTTQNIDKENEESKTEENVTENQNDEVQKNRIYLGDIVNAEQYSALYKSADAQEPNGAIGDISQNYGVNKIACVIDGETFSTSNHTADEIYEMAEKAGVNVDYHLDKTSIIDGRECVQVSEVGNPATTFIYNDNGVPKYSNGCEFSADVDSGLGWVKDGIEKKDIEYEQVQYEDKEVENYENYVSVEEVKEDDAKTTFTFNQGEER